MKSLKTLITKAKQSQRDTSINHVVDLVLSANRVRPGVSSHEYISEARKAARAAARVIGRYIEHGGIDLKCAVYAFIVATHMEKRSMNGKTIYKLQAVPGAPFMFALEDVEDLEVQAKLNQRAEIPRGEAVAGTKEWFVEATDTYRWLFENARLLVNFPIFVENTSVVYHVFHPTKKHSVASMKSDLKERLAEQLRVYANTLARLLPQPVADI